MLAFIRVGDVIKSIKTGKEMTVLDITDHDTKVLVQFKGQRPRSYPLQFVAKNSDLVNSGDYKNKMVSTEVSVPNQGTTSGRFSSQVVNEAMKPQKITPEFLNQFRTADAYRQEYMCEFPPSASDKPMPCTTAAISAHNTPVSPLELMKRTMDILQQTPLEIKLKLALKDAFALADPGVVKRVLKKYPELVDLLEGKKK